ncbi:ArsO family NAD(P)H-dependent flavin-containing monooxygenase [soil metagenome]
MHIPTAHDPGTHERAATVIIGGGQAGLSVGYHLARRGLPFVILDANERVGDAWRQRWNSLRLFTPARNDGLDGLSFPAPGGSYPTKDQMADYLESYAEHFDLPVRRGTVVDRLSRVDGRFVVTSSSGTGRSHDQTSSSGTGRSHDQAAGDEVIEADHVVVAMGTHQRSITPTFAGLLDPGIMQLDAMTYRRPSQLQSGDVLVVGAGNSGAEIALDLARDHRVWLSGRHPGHLPLDIDGIAYRHVLSRLVLRLLFHRVFTVRTRIGRRVRRNVDALRKTLVRTRPRDLAAAGIARVARVAGVRDGLPLLADGRVVDVANVVWCTGSEPGFTWIDRELLGGAEPDDRHGMVAASPGLYFVGLDFVYSVSSGMVHGVGRDADRVAAAIAGQLKRQTPVSTGTGDATPSATTSRTESAARA